LVSGGAAERGGAPSSDSVSARRSRTLYPLSTRFTDYRSSSAPVPLRRRAGPAFAPAAGGRFRQRACSTLAAWDSDHATRPRSLAQVERGAWRRRTEVARQSPENRKGRRKPDGICLLARMQADTPRHASESPSSSQPFRKHRCSVPELPVLHSGSADPETGSTSTHATPAPAHHPRYRSLPRCAAVRNDIDSDTGRRLGNDISSVIRAMPPRLPERAIPSFDTR